MGSFLSENPKSRPANCHAEDRRYLALFWLQIYAQLENSLQTVTHLKAKAKIESNTKSFVELTQVKCRFCM